MVEPEEALIVELIVNVSGGYPYFIQFICKETFDVFMQKMDEGDKASVPIAEIELKLDTDFFQGRWSRATDRQRELLTIAANLENSSDEFSVQELVDNSKEQLSKPFSNSNVNQMLNSLIKSGLIYRNRFGKYSFAVPLLDRYIRRTTQNIE